MEYIFIDKSRTSSFITSRLSDRTVIITTDYDDIFVGVNYLLSLSILITILLFVLGVIIIVFHSKSIVEPIKLSTK